MEFSNMPIWRKQKKYLSTQCRWPKISCRKADELLPYPPWSIQCLISFDTIWYYSLYFCRNIQSIISDDVIVNIWCVRKWWLVSSHCPACRTTLVATRFRVAVICPIIQVPHCIRVFFYFVWFVFINHISQFYNELCTYCNILDIYLS